MEVELRFFATVREAVGTASSTREFDPGTTVRDALAALEADHPDLDGMLLDDAGEVAASVTVMRNGVHVAHREGADTRLADGDRLSLTPPVTGG